jgi:bifunctional non-homologous end joining protein LigD
MAGNGEPEVRITSRERVIFPEAELTKGDLADYYVALAPPMLEFAARRPVSLVRCPEGTDLDCFYQKHGHAGLGPHVHCLPIREKSGEMADYLYLDDTAGILECVQMGTIEFHGWASLADDLEHPERMVFDLDPDLGLGFSEVKRAAQHVRELLAGRGLESFATLTGGKGVHVVVPLTPGHSWEAHSGFAKALAQAMEEAEPERFTATMSKEKRKGKIFVDWLRNARGATAIVPYSARAHPTAPVAAPVSWDELDGIGSARKFTIRDAPKLLERAKSDALKGWGHAEQLLPKSP